MTLKKIAISLLVFLFAAGSGSTGLFAKELETVEVDLNELEFKEKLPFDVPFTLKGKVDKDIKKVKVKYKIIDDSGKRTYEPKTEEWQREGSNQDYFKVIIKSLHPNIKYKFTFLIYKMLNKEDQIFKDCFKKMKEVAKKVIDGQYEKLIKKKVWDESPDKITKHDEEGSDKFIIRKSTFINDNLNRMSEKDMRAIREKVVNALEQSVKNAPKDAKSRSGSLFDGIISEIEEEVNNFFKERGIKFFDKKGKETSFILDWGKFVELIEIISRIELNKLKKEEIDPQLITAFEAIERRNLHGEIYKILKDPGSLKEPFQARWTKAMAPQMSGYEKVTLAESAAIFADALQKTIHDVLNDRSIYEILNGRAKIMGNRVLPADGKLIDTGSAAFLLEFIKAISSPAFKYDDKTLSQLCDKYIAPSIHKDKVKTRLNKINSLLLQMKKLLDEKGTDIDKKRKTAKIFLDKINVHLGIIQQLVCCKENQKPTAEILLDMIIPRLDEIVALKKEKAEKELVELEKSFFENLSFKFVEEKETSIHAGSFHDISRSPKSYISLDFGGGYAFDVKAPFLYAGVNIYFIPINPKRSYVRFSGRNWLFKKFSLLLGLTTSMGIEDGNNKNLFASSSLVLCQASIVGFKYVNKTLFRPLS